ncbi:histidine phosphatase superfamily [Chaetomium fimeti]|uniref:Histidine phosphatase superfamily n=1 Tax=Chaetomium fimeti TaxID=1854472 RepID=A0AAE0LNP0_9PEZI|nr:histidine phosphatase superfamily [Chaetomium fimeti]
MASHAPKLRYSAVTGYFKNDAQPTSSAGPGLEAVTLPGLGLIDQVYETDEAFDPQREKHGWERFAHYLGHLNKTGGGKTVYKLLYAARHGEGYHNVKEREVGTPAWESHWAKLEGDGHTTWADAHLTATGIAQARAMATFWADAAVTARLPLARSHYCSPHARCLETCELAFATLALPPGAGEVPVPPFRPVVKEMIRERLGVHTCDRRRTRSWIRESHPLFVVEEGLTEEDELWRADVRETLEEHAVRMRAFLDELFAGAGGGDGEQIVSVTAHSGSIRALYEVLGHPGRKVAPGTIVPVLIKGEVVDDAAVAQP